MRSGLRIFKAHSLLIFLLFLLTGCTASPKVVWKFKTGAPLYRSPSIWKEWLIAGSNDHYLYAIDLKTGKQMWKRNLGERILSKPYIDGDSIYAGTGDGNFVCLNAADGQVRWVFKTGSMVEFDPCGDQDGIYFGSWDNHFYKVSKAGQKIWEYPTTQRFTTSCIFYKNYVVTTSWDTNLLAFDRATGKVEWKVSSGQFNYGPPTISGDRVYFASHKFLYVADARTGQLLNKEDVGYLDHVVIFDNFLWTNENGITKRTLDGSAITHIEMMVFGPCSPAVGNGFLVVSASPGLVGLTSDGNIRWKWKGGDSFWAPGVFKDGVYYAGNRDGYVYALRLPQ